MTKTQNKPLLFGPTGKPLAMSRLYPSLRHSRPTSRPRPRLNRDTRVNVNECDRWEMVNTSRLLFARLSNLGTAIKDKNQWAFGDAWEPHYTGANDRWGLEATAFLREQFFPSCDRLGRYDWKTILYLSGIAWDRDGDDLMLLTEEDNGSGFPKVEIISSERIGNGRTSDWLSRRVQGGPYDGNRIFDGIIFDETGRPVAARVTGLNEDKETYEDYALGFGGNADLAYNPEWHDQGRGIPLVARVSEDFVDLEDIDTFLKRGIKRASSVGLISKTEEGEAGLGNEMLSEAEVTRQDGIAATITYEEVGDGGEIYYLRKDGESLEGLDYQAPHSNVENFIKRIERRGLRGVGWFYELVNLSESGRAAMRLVCDLANQSIWQQQSIGLRRTWRAVRYALAKAMKNGFLSRNPNARDAYFNWEFGLPKELSVDAGNDEQADRENLKMATTTKALIAQKKGRYWLELQRQRKAEILQNVKDATEIAAMSGGNLSFDRALDMMEQRGPNPVAPAQQPAAKRL